MLQQKYDYKRVVVDDNCAQTSQHFTQESEAISKLGDAGWELVGVSNPGVSGSRTVLYFMRPILK